MIASLTARSFKQSLQTCMAQEKCFKLPECLTPCFQYPRSKIYSAKDPRVQHDFAEDSPFTLQNCPADDYCLYYTSPVIPFQ